MGFRRAIHLIKHLGISTEQFKNLMKLGKTKFPKYEIIIL